MERRLVSLVAGLLTVPPSDELPALLLPQEEAFAAPSVLLLPLKIPSTEDRAPAMEDVRATLPPAAGGREEAVLRTGYQQQSAQCGVLSVVVLLHLVGMYYW
jgi:hypothetical protein